MHRTIVIRREYLHFIPKYSRYEKRHKNLAAHVSPAFRVEEGDRVTVGQCRPLSKTVGGITRRMTNSNTIRFVSTFCACCLVRVKRSSNSTSSSVFMNHWSCGHGIDPMQAGTEGKHGEYRGCVELP
jgi:hypothetical protein